MRIGYMKALLPKGWKVLDIDGKDVYIGCTLEAREGEYYEKIVRMLEKELNMELAGGGWGGGNYYENHFISKSRVMESRRIRSRMLDETEY